MPIRPATRRDLPIMASVLGSAFQIEELHTVLVPHSHEFPEDYIRMWTHKLREDYWDYSRKLEVSYDIDEKGGETVVGVAVWKRYGDGWEGLWGIKSRWDPRLLITKFLETIHRIHRSIFRNRASVQPSPSNPNPYTWWTWQDAVMPFVAKYFVPPSRAPPSYSFNNNDNNNLHASSPSATASSNQPFWELSTLGVVPSSQNKGHGRNLAKHGLKRARCDGGGRSDEINVGVPAVVVAADHKEDFYRACGFGVLVGWATEGEGNPLKMMGVGGGAILWTGSAGS